MNASMISIIIPTLNEEAHILGCLNSLLSMDYPAKDFEIILVDNGSSDHTRVLAQGLATTIIRNDKLNVAGLRNIGVNNARGDILAFLDADCTVSTHWLQAASRYFNDKKIAAWGSPPDIPDKATWVQKTWFLVRKNERSRQRVNWLESMNFFTRKELFEKVGGFNESMETCEDVDFCYKVKKYGVILSDISIEATHHGEADTIRKFIKKEIWRGKANLKGVFSHGFRIEELPSLAIPLYFSTIMPMVLIGFFIFQTAIWFIATAFLIIIPSVGVLFKLRAKNLKPREKSALVILLQAYFLSRTIAVYPGLRDFIISKL